MHSRFNLNRFRFLAGWLTSGLLTTAPVALAGNEAEYAKQRAAEQEQALRTQRTISRFGDVSCSTFPLMMLSPGIKYEVGKVSLIPDPTDRGGGRIAVYLVNATDQPLPGADSEARQCLLEAKDGGQWRACDNYLFGCGNIPLPKDLPPGYGQIFSAADPSVGDVEGELRYYLSLPSCGFIVSASFPGKYDSRRMEEATFKGYAGAAIMNGLDGRKWWDVSWSVPHSREECLAAAELERCEGGFTKTRSALVLWKDRNLPGEQMAYCRAIIELLARPWYPDVDGSRLIQRCAKALTHVEPAEFGSPERCRAMIWRYLKCSRRMREIVLRGMLVGPEQWERMKKDRLSGNPWGADRESFSILIREAVESQHSPNREEREAVAEFLSGSWIKPVYWPDNSDPSGSRGKE